MVIYFNDQPAEPAKSGTLADLLRLMGREASRTVVTVNGGFVPPSDYKKFKVPDGARVAARELLDGG
jgi:thiamine biosynthesis protein ThiS